MEEQEEKQGLGFIGNAVQIVILGWSLAVISWSYFGNSTRQIDTTFAAGLLSAVMSNYGLNVKKTTDKRKQNGNLNIVDNKDSKVGVVKK
tara:strand:- start:276 stop:545 length:270 start_codon:yes stop_codon:yes gene_type:complete